MKYTQLIKAIDSTNEHLLVRAAAVVNQSLVMRNWLIGAYIVEFEQCGEDRARYGLRLLERLSADLAKRNIKGLADPRILRDCRSIYRLYPQIRGTLSREFDLSLPHAEIHPPLSVKAARRLDIVPIRGTASREMPTPLSPKLMGHFSWSKLQELVRIEDPWKRAFYENECLKGNWSVRQLQRQIGSLLYERTGLSTNKAAVLRRAHRQEPKASIEELIRDPYVLEFAGLAELPAYQESDLEQALLNHLQSFLLELGTGFCFEARQKRITVGTKHDYIDLVFYQRRLRCHVLLDLKVRPFEHGDAGQMNFYLNWWKKHGCGKGDRPPVGVVLCSDRERAEVEFATAGMSNKLFVSRYLVALPSADQLRSFLEADRDRVEAIIERNRFVAKPRKKTKARIHNS